MSLVGSLEDLGLGEILQIISLSRKSGVLVLRSEHGEGEIVFAEGLIRGAFTKGGPTELRELLAARGAVEPAALDGAWKAARSAEGGRLDAELVRRELLDEEALDRLRRENAESAVLEMFRWPTGEFSFEIREGPDEAVHELFIEPGVNPQFLALEGTRRIDEEEEPDDDAPMFDGEEAAPAAAEAAEAGAEPAAESAAPAAEALADAVEAEGGEDALVAEVVAEGDEAEAAAEAAPEPSGGGSGASDALEAEPEARAEPAAPAAAPEAAREAPAAAPAPGPAAGVRRDAPVVALEPTLAGLEWLKEALAGLARVHVFQRSEHAIQRIRQYLARGEVPLVLLAADAPPDPLSGARDAAEIARRLKAQSQRMTLLLLGAPEPKAPPPATDARVRRPDATQLADPRCAADREALAAELRRAVDARLGSPAPGGAAGLPPATVARLKEISARMRDPGSRGEVLPQVLRFAAETFARVALFMVREDRLQGLAQAGLPAAGGPDDAGLREIALPRAESAWIRTVLERRTPLRSAPTDAGDRRLAILLGNDIPREAYVAPLESGEQVVALLYGDNLPADDPIGDTSALEVVLHEAGLALDRALLERTLEESEA